MLTVDYRRLDLRPGHRVLDLGCGAGRHAFESFRRGAHVVALDADDVELKGVAAILAAMDEAGEAHPLGRAVTVRADALALPFADGAFDRVIAAEVLEHIPGDRSALAELARVLAPGGRIAITVPRFWPELVNWALSDEYHLVPGGHVRIYRRGVLAERMAAAGLEPYDRHHAHALHSPYWWLRCAVGPHREDHLLVAAYRRLLEWDITHAPPATRLADRALNPVLGKSLVLYAKKAT